MKILFIYKEGETQAAKICCGVTTLMVAIFLIYYGFNTVTQNEVECYLVDTIHCHDNFGYLQFTYNNKTKPYFISSKNQTICDSTCCQLQSFDTTFYCWYKRKTPDQPLIKVENRPAYEGYLIFSVIGLIMVIFSIVCFCSFTCCCLRQYYPKAENFEYEKV